MSLAGWSRPALGLVSETKRPRDAGPTPLRGDFANRLRICGFSGRPPGRSLPLPRAMEKFVIQGGVPLSGELTVAGNKNAALPILAACLLTEEELLLHRVPRIRDTEAQIALLERLGVEVAWVADNSLRLCAADVGEVEVDEDLSSRIRASFLLAGPLLARFGEARMPPPGGDFIGRRRLDAHLDAFKELGARVDGDRWIELSGAARGAARLRSLHGRAIGDGHRERADGGGIDPRARRRSPTPPPSPTFRTSPACWPRWGPRLTGSAPT